MTSQASESNGYAHRPEHGEWQELRRLEQLLDQGQAIPLDTATQRLLVTIAGQVGLEAAQAAQQATTASGVETLIREERRRIREGSRRLAQAINDATKLAAAGRHEEARVPLEAIIESEVVPFYRELAASEIRSLEQQR